MRIMNETDSSFTPFVISLKVESEQEARLLWHVFNRLHLKDAIFTSNYGRGYNEDMSDDFEEGCTEVKAFIKSKVSITEAN